MVGKVFLFAFLAALPLFAAGEQAVKAVKAEGEYKNMVKGGMHYYAFTQGFPKAHSIWSAMGITSDDMIYVGVSDHTVNSGLFKYDSKKDVMIYLGDVLGNGKLWLHEWQGKIHTPIIQNPKDGLVYFGTDAGNGIWECAGIPGSEYVGGHWFVIDPKTDKISDLGLGTRYMGLKSIAVDPIHNRLFATTDPSSHFIIYNIDKGKSPKYEEEKDACKDLGCINGAHEPRMVWTDKWGNCYTVNEIGQLVEYVAATGELRRLNSVLIPMAPGTPTWQPAQGASAVLPVNDKEFYYGITYYGRLFKHVPEEKGEGKVIDLGNGWGNDNYNDQLKIGCLALGQNNKLYYVIGGHGRFVTADSSAILVEFDPETKKKTLIYKFDQIVTECTGGATDTKGNIYFAAHGQSVPEPGKEAIRKPYLIKFHPSTIERAK